MLFISPFWINGEKKPIVWPKIQQLVILSNHVLQLELENKNYKL